MHWRGYVREGVVPPLRKGQIFLGRLVVVLLVVGRVSQNVARLALADAYRGRQLFFLDRHRLRVLVLPLVHGAPSRVHEEVADRRRLQAQLPRDCHLHLLRRPLGLLSGEKDLYHFWYIAIISNFYTPLKFYITTTLRSILSFFGQTTKYSASTV